MSVVGRRADRDLFGQDVMRRSAFFPQADNRRRLSRDWGPGPRAFVLGCNPSTAGELLEDPTTHWLNAWFRLFGFGGYDLGNLYSFCTSSPIECRRRYDDAIGGPNWDDRDELFANLGAVVQMAKRADQVFVCFGNIACVPIVRGRLAGDDDKGGPLAFAWFVWEHSHVGPPTLGFLDWRAGP